jgi:hypothetical protein
MAEQKKPIKGFDLASLASIKTAPAMPPTLKTAFEEAQKHLSDTGDMQRRIEGLQGRGALGDLMRKFEEQKRALDGLVPMSLHEAALKKHSIGIDAGLASMNNTPAVLPTFKTAFEEAQKHLSITGDMPKRIKEQLGRGMLGETYYHILATRSPFDQEWNRPIAPIADGLSTSFKIPPSPLIETNKRLAKIEKHFEEMQDTAARGAEIAARAAEIGTGLQLLAADFLVKFDEAATKNDRTAGRAVKVAIAAAIFAVAVPAVQTLYSELWKAPSDTAEMRRAVTELKGELTILRDTQRQVADRIAEVVSSQSVGSQELVTTLKDIRKALSDPPTKQP